MQERALCPQRLVLPREAPPANSNAKKTPDDNVEEKKKVSQTEGQKACRRHPKTGQSVLFKCVSFVTVQDQQLVKTTKQKEKKIISLNGQINNCMKRRSRTRIASGKE